jgi:hypothetical protein
LNVRSRSPSPGSRRRGCCPSATPSSSSLPQLGWASRTTRRGSLARDGVRMKRPATRRASCRADLLRAGEDLRRRVFESGVSCEVPVSPRSATVKATTPGDEDEPGQERDRRCGDCGAHVPRNDGGVCSDVR